MVQKHGAWFMKPIFIWSVER